MPTASACILLIRGINVGKANRISMSALSKALADAGYTRVRTLLASGNVVLDAPCETPASVASAVEKLLSTQFSINTGVVALGADTVARAIARNPLATIADDPTRLLIILANNRKALTSLAPLQEVDWGSEEFALTGQAAYLWCPNGVSAGTLAEAAFKQMPKAATSRNLNTLNRLVSLASAAAGDEKPRRRR